MISRRRVLEVDAAAINLLTMDNANALAKCTNKCICYKKYMYLRPRHPTVYSPQTIWPAAVRSQSTHVAQMSSYPTSRAPSRRVVHAHRSCRRAKKVLSKLLRIRKYLNMYISAISCLRNCPQGCDRDSELASLSPSRS